MSKLRWHLGQLDAMRGIAVLGTVAVHSAYLFPQTHLGPILFSGQRGVQLFFIVSAFTLFLSFDNRKEEKRPTTNFFLRRVFRLVPLYYCMILFAVIFDPKTAGNWYQILLAAFFLHGFHPDTIPHGAAGGWTLANEFMFYLCLPLAFKRIASLWDAVWAYVLITPLCWACCHFLAYRYPTRADFYTFLFFPAELPVFLTGIVCFFLWKELQAPISSMSSRNRIALSMSVLAVAFTFYCMALPVSDNNLYPTTLICSLLLLSALLHEWGLLVNRVTIFLGKISFSVYLLHSFILHRFASFLDSLATRHLIPGREVYLTLDRFLGTLIITVPLATLTWMFIEEPGIRMGRRLIAKMESTVLMEKDVQALLPAQAVLAEGNSPDAQF
jgi:peptidoglycan/LPS O-acetylase OafA/YrhL